MLRSSPLLALLVSAFALGACGDDSSGGNDDLASKSPRQIIRESAAALRTVRSYHIEGTQADAEGTTRIAADLTAAGPMRFQLATKGQKVEMIAVDEAIWRAQGGPGGEQIERIAADRWVKAPDAVAQVMQADLRRLRPSELAYCLTRTPGTITKAGTRSLDGQHVVVLENKGDRPGSSPGELSIATSGPPLPLREVQTGATKPGGGRDSRCDDPESTTTTGDARISDYNEVAPIAAPKDALDLASAQRDTAA